MSEDVAETIARELRRAALPVEEQLPAEVVEAAEDYARAFEPNLRATAILAFIQGWRLSCSLTSR